nr:immunoglobulin light chain junction region [Macaca mulatta]MOX29920.1 immunoglobulin light chain junction region [Macaca mulatta]MOX31606.1 immunoglobulin light chain junction region [Macaca mulatta]MOX33082.1 immunoglobulin light chain junction region [Macaca mulatta]
DYYCSTYTGSGTFIF